MGAINYGTSDYITLGLKPYDTDDFYSNKCFMDEIEKEIKEYGGTIEEAIADYIDTCYESDYENISFALSKQNFKFFKIEIKHGYYEGFYLDIKEDLPIYFDCWQEKAEAQKEISEIKKFLIECVGMGLVSVRPGWCTSYGTYKGTLKEISFAIKTMRAEVKCVQTYLQYCKA